MYLTMKFLNCHYTHERHLAIDFLYPMTPEKPALFINKNSLEVEFDFLVFFKPFEKLTWFTILSSSLVTTLMVTAIWKFCGKNETTMQKCLKLGTINLKTNLGHGNFDLSNNTGTFF